MDKSTNKTVSLWMVVFALALVLTASQAIAADKKPNILFIMGDDIGIMNVGAYHQGLMVGETPTSIASGMKVRGL